MDYVQNNPYHTVSKVVSHVGEMEGNQVSAGVKDYEVNVFVLGDVKNFYCEQETDLNIIKEKISNKIVISEEEGVDITERSSSYNLVLVAGDVTVNVIS